MNATPTAVELNRIVHGLQTLRQQHEALHLIDPALKRLEYCGQHIHDTSHAVALELSQISSALTGLLSMLDQSGLDSLECEQVYCLLEPFARRLRQSSEQLQRLV
ncbi:DUF1484 family protein [Chromobacterium aquaticum]|uniref:DUF1484 family protein n=1 Tax=Chromobacterium aquaticum TaxID=467180 RepID=A0ABV8ZQT0_9NEIS|nr:DUF1484 family protein [Chromobacterium aquaticum]MCD5360355.1 DUF1484 domain-containing protein [Chromobacterium aquaticum]